MRTFYSLSIIALLVFSLSACKKDAKPQIPASLVGKWYIRQYTITASSNTFTDAPYTVRYSDTATNAYYQFSSDGTGAEQTNTDPAIVSLATGFQFHVSGTNITFSNTSDILMMSSCSFEMPTSQTLIIHGTYSYTQGAYVINNLQEVFLSKY